jgi:hypothetical protein
MQIVRRCKGCGIRNAEACPNTPTLCVVCGKHLMSYNTARHQHKVNPTEATKRYLDSYVRYYQIALQAGYYAPVSIKKGPSVR